VVHKEGQFQESTSGCSRKGAGAAHVDEPYLSAPARARGEANEAKSLTGAPILRPHTIVIPTESPFAVRFTDRCICTLTNGRTGNELRWELFQISVQRGSSNSQLIHEPRVPKKSAEKQQFMSPTVRPLFKGVHRQLRLHSMRLGEDWQIEVRPLTLTHQPPKVLHIKDSIPVPEHERNLEPPPTHIPPPVH
jgi:hypothetical protein